MNQRLTDIDGDASGIAQLTDSDRHRILTNEQRRIALDVLTDASGPVHLEELASVVAARENGTETADSVDVERAAIALHHNHLPRMADADIVEYDAGARQVRC